MDTRGTWITRSVWQPKNSRSGVSQRVLALAAAVTHLAEQVKGAAEGGCAGEQDGAACRFDGRHHRLSVQRIGWLVGGAQCVALCAGRCGLVEAGVEQEGRYRQGVQLLCCIC